MTAVMSVPSLLLLQITFYYFEDALVGGWPVVYERSDSEIAK
jgi:hypothetical protein